MPLKLGVRFVLYQPHAWTHSSTTHFYPPMRVEQFLRWHCSLAPAPRRTTRCAASQKTQFPGWFHDVCCSFTLRPCCIPESSAWCGTVCSSGTRISLVFPYMLDPKRKTEKFDSVPMFLRRIRAKNHKRHNDVWFQKWPNLCLFYHEAFISKEPWTLIIGINAKKGGWRKKSITSMHIKHLQLSSSDIPIKCYWSAPSPKKKQKTKQECVDQLSYKLCMISFFQSVCLHTSPSDWRVSQEGCWSCHPSPQTSSPWPELLRAAPCTRRTGHWTRPCTGPVPPPNEYSGIFCWEQNGATVIFQKLMCLR